MKTKKISAAEISLLFNLLYAIGNGALGLYYASEWFLCVGAYYAILSVLRFGNIRAIGKNEGFMTVFSGCMLILLVPVLMITVYLAIRYGVGEKYHEIIMITIALYTFIKVTLSVVKYIKSRKQRVPTEIAMSSIGFADGAVAIFSLQRSMLVSFGEMGVNNIKVFNLLTGIGVCIIVLYSGIKTIKVKEFCKNG